ncbi:hypothetical protein BC351_37430 [Paenibacillus ferrarius]|uniref:Uncharacterized protein n=1 Tax=Paenibacillus ferrarius TaxID=1469647 RepID=A0A1V4HBV2_9BACL|nr:hypothetical protein BC351_37430 [Paenibacillus ferrarius]
MLVWIGMCAGLWGCVWIWMWCGIVGMRVIWLWGGIVGMRVNWSALSQTDIEPVKGNYVPLFILKTIF